MYTKPNKVKCNKMEYATAKVRTSTYEFRVGAHQLRNTIPSSFWQETWSVPLDEVNQEDCRLGGPEGIIRSEALDS